MLLSGQEEYDPDLGTWCGLASRPRPVGPDDQLSRRTEPLNTM